MDISSAFDVAVVGVGMGSAPHLRALADLRADYRLTWVCARDAQRLAAVELPAGPRPTTQLDDILQDPGVRAAMVLTPPSAHLDVVRKVAVAGKHVLVEKPLELDLARARELVACCDAAGVKLAVTLQYRMRGGALRLAELLRSGELGSLPSAGADAGYPERIEINASRGSATLEAGRLQVAYADGRSETLEADTGSGGGADPMAFDHGPHRAVLRDFLDAVRTDRAPAVTGRSALLAHTVIDAIIASAACGVQVAPVGDIS